MEPLDDQLLDLLETWESKRRSGAVISPEDLTQGDPALADRLRRAIERLGKAGWIGATIADSSHSDASKSGKSEGSWPVGGILGPYEFLEMLGKGGMGAVFKARHTRLNKFVAIKVLPKTLIRDDEAIARFDREIKAVGALEHPNIIRATDADEDRGVHYLVMEYVDGEDLYRHVKQHGPLPVAQACQLVRDAASALDHIHRLGLVHRDVKPSNLLLMKSGQLKVLDLGLARLSKAAGEDGELTGTGVSLGTPDYMAPEQWSDASRADARTDLYALGCTLHYLLLGRAPFVSEQYGSVIAKMTGHAQGLVPSLRDSRPDIPLEIDVLCRKLLAKKPDDRIQTAAELVQRLEPFSSSMRSAAAEVSDPAAPLTSPQSKSTLRHRLPRNISTLLGVALAGLVLLVAAVVYRIQTNYGTLILTTGNEHVAARLKEEGLVIQDAKTGQTWSLIPNVTQPVPPGDYRLPKPKGLLVFVRDDSGTKVSATEFKVQRGDRTAVHVTLAPRGTVPTTEDVPLDAEVVTPHKTADAWRWNADAPQPAIAPFDTTQAKQYQEAWAKHLDMPVEYTNSVGMKFVLIPPGEFIMGSAPEEIEEALAETKKVDPQNTLNGRECVKSAAPRHKVILTQPFYVGTTEVTQAQYERVIGSNPSQFASSGRASAAVKGIDTSSHPVDSISWSDAADFCRKLSQHENLRPFYLKDKSASAALESLGYRLPTEAEWEFACRAGANESEAGIEDHEQALHGWYKPHSLSRPHAVRELKPNAFGLFDMRGNVWEWVEDWLDVDYYSRFADSPAIDPTAPAIGSSKRVFRGGSWSDRAPFCRASNRGAFDPESRFGSFGLRVVLPPAAAKALIAGNSDPSPQTTGRHDWPADAPKPAIAPFDTIQAKQYQDAWAKYLEVPVEYTNSLEMKFVLIPPGEYLMGSTATEVANEAHFVDKSDARWMECLQTEAPQHRVILTDALYVGIHEVTQKQFRALSDQTKAVAKADEEDRPILWVTHANAEDFCGRLCVHEGLPDGKKQGDKADVSTEGGYRLLTEAEWEFACRAGTTTRFWPGPEESDLEETCWYRNNSRGHTHSVGTRRPNSFGLHDMLGNAWEWCQDQWSPTYYAASASGSAVNPQGPESTMGIFVARGGDWHDAAAVCRTAFRYGFPAKFSSNGMSFRVALTWKTVRELQQRK